VSMAAEDHVVTLSSVPKLMREVRVRLTQTGAIDVTTSSGSFWFGRQPQLASAYTTYAGQYDQCKVVGMRLTLQFAKAGYIAATGSNTTQYPTAVVIYYDNDNNIAASGGIAAAVDYASAAYASCEGVTSYSLPSLPTAMMYTASVTGGVTISSEWIDCLYPTNLYGGIGVQLDRVLISTALPLRSVGFVVEYDTVFRGRR